MAVIVEKQTISRGIKGVRGAVEKVPVL